MLITRRELFTFASSILGLAVAARKLRGTAASRLHIDSLLEESDLALQSPVLRNYRVDVVVALLGVPIFSRKGVGSAFAAIREASAADQRIVALQFAGGANPERTHGFRYDGSMDEAAFESSSARQVAYFGFVTSASDENFERARQRIMSKSKAPRSFIAAEGVHSAGSAHCEKSRVSIQDQSAKLGELSHEIRDGFAESDRMVTELPTPGLSAASTFLNSVLEALRSGQTHSQRSYIHNAKQYRIEWERAPDPHVGTALSATQLTLHPDAVTRFTARTSALSARQSSTFRLWLDNESDLPLRIEFQPRSYLRLMLEYEPSTAQPINKHGEEI